MKIEQVKGNLSFWGVLGYRGLILGFRGGVKFFLFKTTENWFIINIYDQISPIDI